MPSCPIQCQTASSLHSDSQDKCLRLGMRNLQDVRGTYGSSHRDGKSWASGSIHLTKCQEESAGCGPHIVSKRDGHLGQWGEVVQ